MKKIAQVCIYAPFNYFDYLLPESESGLTLSVGMRVLVPFGKQSKVGIIFSFSEDAACDPKKLKRILQVIDSQPILPLHLLSVLEWVAQYYYYPLGAVVTGVLPALLRKAKNPVNIETWLDKPSVHTTSAAELITSNILLTEEQKKVLQEITAKKGFYCWFLYGVTGSGKTEVYSQLIERTLLSGKQVLVLVPEIGLTPQIVERLQNRFLVPIVCLHSNVTQKKRLEAWCQAYSGTASIVVGTRSAVFTSFRALGLIVIDESHDMSFKQQTGIRYSAKDVAIFRAKKEDIPVILGSATPALETLMNVKKQLYTQVSLSSRVAGGVLPKVIVLDTRNQPLTAGLSSFLLERIAVCLEQGKQVLIFLNRRGYAPTLLCKQCGWMLFCKYCDARMTVHISTNSVCCHHCGARALRVKNCLVCQSEDIIEVGVGTEQLEYALQDRFLKFPVVRVDRDSVAKKGQFAEKLKIINSEKPCIIVGTQMLTKGHHFANLSLVGVVEADFGLYSVDFRATEQMAQMLIQVAGRSGRITGGGEVIIQTHFPEHPLFKDLFGKGYCAAAERILAERRAMSLPPYTYLALLRADSLQETQALDFLQCVKKQIPHTANVAIWGPAPAPMLRRGNWYRAQIFICAQKRVHLHRLVSQVKTLCFVISKKEKGIRWFIDIDPQEIS